MAAAAPSPLASSVEKTNGAKLSRLLIDGGTTVLKNIFDSYYSPANLAADFNVQYKVLFHLLRRRILNKLQWDKLFPPSGAKPDSSSFDITLLFLLLTNICGLSPPLSGWHTKPPPSDTSLEANLARIKYFRNELYGHVSKTGVDTSTFNVRWQELSAVLVALGLGQAEIDRLKVERCGEDDYFDVLIDWADSELETSSQLKEVAQNLTKTQQVVTSVIQNQLEDRKTLEDSYSKLGEVYQIETETHQAVKEALQTQLEDNKTLQDSISKLESESQTQTKIRQAVEGVHETLQVGLQEVKQVVENLSTKLDRARADELLRNLAKSEFKGDIEYHSKRFQEGTREWIFKRVEDWLDDRTSPNRVMVISGNAGMGKSVLSAVTCKRMENAGRLSGSHFCQHNNVRYRKPQLMLQSLASHLSDTLPEYKKCLVEQLSRNVGPIELNSMGVEELFALLFKEPLNSVNDPGRDILMVIDGLDESEYQGRNELLDVIANQFFRLPQWIRFFVTTRPEINIADSLKNLQPIQLDENQEENLRDIRLFFEMRLSHKIKEENKDVLLRKLVEKSEGVFLYAYFLMDYIQENVSLLTLEQLESSLPLGISSVYRSHFKRLENELCKELKVDEDEVLSFLCAVTTSREPLPVAFVSRLLNPNGGSLSAQRRINKAIACISSLLPVRNECVHFFHKSVRDWLTNTSCYGRHDFTVNEKKGHEILFNLCRDELDNVKRKGVHDTRFSDTERYALQHGVQHMIEVDESGEASRLFSVEELVNAYVADLELIYAKLCVNSTACSEEMISVQRNIKPTLLSERSQSFLVSLLKVLRKHSYLLTDHPHLWFQSVINEGSSELSSKAATILENRLLNVPYMKHLVKEEQNGAVQARFYCSDTVACFDVSPELDHMVCECRDGTIHMWSLETGNKEWVRPSLVKRTYEVVHPYGDRVVDGGAYRRMDYKCLTFYRSVVFHPSGKSVLPGTLKSVYTLKGECNHLFPNSNCTFSHCAFASGKRIILTDCFDDPKKVVLWSMENGQELRIIPWNDDISSFAISQDGSQIAFADVTGSIYRVDMNKSLGNGLFSCKNAVCGLMHFTPDNEDLVCGYLPYRIDFLDVGLRAGWVLDRKPFFILSRYPQLIKTGGIEFVLWPIEPRTLVRKDFFDEGFLADWVNNVHRVFPSLNTGFYKKLSNETALVGGPSFKYVASVNVDLLSKVNSASTREVVEKVVFSSEGDVIYAISSNRDEVGSRAVIVTVFRMSNQEILVKKSFTCLSLSLVPVKEGVVLCFQHRVPELWNFELTSCIRQIPRLKGTEKLIRLSDELIACEWYCRTLTQEEIWDCGSSEYGMALHEEDDSVEQDESPHFDNSPDEDDASLSDDPLVLDVSVDFSNTWFFYNLHLGMMMELFRMLVVDVVNIASGECVSSIKTRVSNEDHVVFVSCLNSKEQLLVCTTEEIDDDFFVDVEQLTVSLRNSKSRLWKRSTKRYDSNSFAPHFMFSTEDRLLVTWGSLDSGYGVHILDAKTGETHHTLLKDHDDIIDCKFVVNDESVVCCSNDNFLRLFNIRSGDLLSVLDIEEYPHCLGACLGGQLVAIGLRGARLKFVHVKLPGVQEAEGKKGEKLWLHVNSSE